MLNVQFGWIIELASDLQAKLMSALLLDFQLKDAERNKTEVILT